jgi:KDO transferase-3
MAEVESPWSWARRKVHKWRIPEELRHMRTAHPGFALAPESDGGYRILWRRRMVGRTRPLTELSTPKAAACFLVGSGPSINELAFQRLVGQDCIGVNGSILKSMESGIAFRSFVALDRNFFTDRFELVQQTLESGAECLFSFRGLSVICERAPELLRDSRVFLMDEINGRYSIPKPSPAEFDAWAEADPDLLLHPTRRPSEGRVGYSLDPRKGVFTGQTIVYSALQLATWLGYRRVFLLGLDLGGTGPDARFYETGAKAASMRLDRDYEPYILPAFEVARSVARSLGARVYNLSPKSRLPERVIPRLTLEQALKQVDEVAHAGT